MNARKRPFVLINGAVSADGKLALENLSLIQFSSRRDRRLVFQLRATADAVLCGAETVETFSIDLTTGPAACRAQRKRRGLRPEPLRVLASINGDVNPKARIFKTAAAPVIVLTTAAGLKRARRAAGHIAVIEAFGRSQLDWPAALQWLRKRWDISRLLCEGGGDTNAALLRAGVVDELHLTICPLILCGSKAPTLCDGEGIAALDRAPRLKLKSATGINGEVFLVYKTARAAGTRRNNRKRQRPGRSRGRKS